jgi:hypothetical protein
MVPAQVGLALRQQWVLRLRNTQEDLACQISTA